MQTKIRPSSIVIREDYCAKDKKGIDSQPKCLCVVESKMERKAVSEEALVHKIQLNLANVACGYAYTSAFSLCLVLCPVSRTVRSSSNVPIPTRQLLNSGTVC